VRFSDLALGKKCRNVKSYRLLPSNTVGAGTTLRPNFFKGLHAALYVPGMGDQINCFDTVGF